MKTRNHVCIAGLLFAMLLAGLPSLVHGQEAIDRRLKEQRTEVKGTTPAQWRVIWTKHPESRATISWSTAEKGTNHRVYYDTTSRDGRLYKYANKWTAQNTGPYTDQEDLFYHHASITELEPDTTYYFVLASGESTSPELHFTTAPAEDQSFRLLTGGASHSDPTMRRRMNLLIRRLHEEFPDVLALAHGGGYVKKGTNRKMFSNWMSDYELTTTPAGKVLPIIPARGRRERSGSLFQNVFHSPGWENNVFSTRIGPELLLITLNTTIKTGEQQRTFLEKTLKSNDDVRWKIAQYNQPIYPAVQGHASHRKVWTPVFERFGLDLALEYRGAVFKRTVPILDGTLHPEGVVYMGEGGLGVPPQSPEDDRWYLDDSGQVISSHHVTILNVGSSVLRTQTVNAFGRTIDCSILRP